MMSGEMIVILAIVCVALLMLVVGYIGNKVVDKGSDAIRNAAVRRKKTEQPPKTESLAERYQK